MMMFLYGFSNFLLRVSFPREQRPAGRCTVPGSALSMSSFPDCRSRRARRLQCRASSGATITQNSTGREERSRTEPSLCPSPCAAGTPRWLRGLQLPQMKAAFIPSCRSILRTARVFSLERVLVIMHNDPSLGDCHILSSSQKSIFIIQFHIQRIAVFQDHVPHRDQPDNFRQFPCYS